MVMPPPLPSPAAPDAWRLGQAQMQALSSIALIWTTGPDGLATEHSPSWEAFTGQPFEVSRGAGWLAALHPDDRAGAQVTWAGSIATKTRMRPLRYRLRRHDGVYRVMAVEAAPVVEGDAVTGWVGTCHDVTEASAFEAALRDSEERLRLLDELGQATRTLTDPSEIMACVARVLGEYLATTRCAYADVEPDNDTFTIRADWSMPGVPSSAGVYSLTLFGPQAMHDMHRGVFLVVRDVDRELGDGAGGRMFKAIGIQAIICAPLVKAGRLVAMMAVHHATPRAWTDREIALVGEVVERCWAHIERVRAAALLREQDQRKDEFMATLAHELRNPLAPMRYATAILQRVPAGSSQATQAQGIMQRQVGMMSRLVDDLLDLSRINRGLIELRRERCDLRQLLEQAAETARHAIEGARHHLQLALPPAGVQVDGDPARLVQVVGNLLNNAAKYTPDGGHIRLAGWQDGARLVVEVNDNGIGIPPEAQGRLFQMFTQLPHTASRSQGGLGIGLALVKRLVQMHEGVVRVHSVGVDQGSTFTVELPVPAPAVPLPAAADAVQAPAAPGRRVLVIEDNPDGRELLVTLLGLLGHDVRSAADGPAGLDLLVALRPDVALVDLGLPKLDGLSIARAVRARPELADVKLVALTGWGAEGDRENTRAAGFDRHLTKPVSAEALQALIEALAAAP